ncbi:MAG: hypothetical protein KAG14_00740, partial [Mycoplasmataceae bacterium]|nr:hypothetical protein [Mycoplasmataceae bacterium]
LDLQYLSNILAPVAEKDILDDGVVWNGGLMTMAFGQEFSFINSIANNLGYKPAKPHTGLFNLDNIKDYHNALPKSDKAKYKKSGFWASLFGTSRYGDYIKTINKDLYSEGLAKANEYMKRFREVDFKNNSSRRNEILNYSALNGAKYGKARLTSGLSQLITPEGSKGPFNVLTGAQWGIALHKAKTGDEVSEDAIFQYKRNAEGDVTNLEGAPDLPYFRKYHSSIMDGAKTYKKEEKGDSFGVSNKNDYYGYPLSSNYRTVIIPGKENRVKLEASYNVIIKDNKGENPILLTTTKDFILDNTLIKGYNKDFSVKNKYPVIHNEEHISRIKSILYKVLEKIFKNGANAAAINGMKGFLNISPGKIHEQEKFEQRALKYKTTMSEEYVPLLEFVLKNKNKITPEFIGTLFDNFNKKGSIYWRSIETMFYGIKDMTTIKNQEINTDIDGPNGKQKYTPSLMFNGRNPDTGYPINLLSQTGSIKGAKDWPSFSNLLSFQVIRDWTNNRNKFGLTI